MLKLLIDVILTVLSMVTTYGTICLTPSVWQAGAIPKLLTVTLWMLVVFVWVALWKAIQVEPDIDSK
jgi:hypothetical protein